MAKYCLRIAWSIWTSRGGKTFAASLVSDVSSSRDNVHSVQRIQEPMPNQTTRRTFLKLTTAAASVTAIEFSHALPTSHAIGVIVDPDSALSTSEPVEWAVEQFREALTGKGITSST